MSKIIQFMHPGRYNCQEDCIKWNCGRHKRKLIKNEIRYIENGSLKNSIGYLWGEWEPESYCKKENGFFVHTIKYPSDVIFNTANSCIDCCSKKTDYLNTDPYVFGDHFIYSNCMQRKYKELQNLVENDIILFGSKSKGGFILDTLFVVDREIKPDEIYSACFKKATYQFIKNDNFKIYKAKMYDPQKAKEIYSFFPCSNYPFKRPVIDLEYIHSIKQGVCYLHKKYPYTKSEDVWNEILNIIKDNGLYIGISTIEPKEL